jgi:hypothetical protein
MKRCPTCNIDYFDEMLEFCLDDGAKLVSMSGSASETPTVTRSNRQNQTANETVALSSTKAPELFELNDANREIEAKSTSPVEASAANPLKEKVTSQSYKVLEIAPVIVSLAHNWWQWVYLHNQYYYTFTSYVFSANFLMWLLLLVAGASVGLLALRLCRNKSFAYTGLVILAINLLLFLVPKG